MAVMENVVRVGKTYKVRKRIPLECRADFGVLGEFKTVSLGTTDKREAQRLALPILAEIEQKIAQIRAGLKPASTAIVGHGPIDRQTAFRRIEDWRRSTIQTASEQAWSAILPPLTNDDAVALSTLRSQLRANVAPEGLGGRLANVLGVAPDHPVLTRSELSQAFLTAWRDVEDFTDDFRHDRFDGWPEESEPAPTSVAAQPIPMKPASGVKLMEAFDLWGGTKTLDQRQRGYVERLSQFLGDPDIGSITPLDMDRFLAQLKKWPNTKRDLSKVTFSEAIRDAAKEPGYRTLHVKTVWNWTVTFKALFEFAVTRDLIEKNPAANMMKKPGAEESNEREAYESEHLKAIFTAPMFHGSDGRGLRDNAGSEIIRDHKYWLPVLAHYTGARLEELASLTRDDVKTEEGIHFIDLTERPLAGPRRVKNRNARRIIPLHDDLIEFGFLDHLRGKTDMVFPELSVDDGKASDLFSKWWGRWCERRATVKGEGIDDPSRTFHSFRHGWMRTARESGVQEKVHDLISGHAGGNAVARGYGRGAAIRVLKDAIDQIGIERIAL